MKLHQINDVETLHAKSLQYRIKRIFIKKRYHPAKQPIIVLASGKYNLKGSKFRA